MGYTIFLIPAPGLFYWRNKRKAIPLFFLVALSVMIISVVISLTDSVMNASYRANVKPYETFSMVVAKQLAVPEDIVEQLLAHEFIDSIIPFLDSQVRVMGLFGSEGRMTLAVPKNSLKDIMTRTGLTLKEGTLPRALENEIIIHEEIARARNVEVGDLIGREIYESDYLWGLFKVTGIMSGNIPIAIASFDYFKQQWAFDTGDFEYAYLVFAKPGKLSGMNEHINSLPTSDIYIRSIETVQPHYETELQNLNLLLWIVNMAVISVMSTAMGLLNVIHFMGRIKEYGIMAAMGITPNHLVIRTLLDVLVLACSGFSLGILMAIGLLHYISFNIFEPRGIQVISLGLRTLVFSVPIPVCVAIFSVITVGWNLIKLDLISVLEGRN